ncbi:hypothetical protein vseg_006796 [Gypsophila vaccaria]
MDTKLKKIPQNEILTLDVHVQEEEEETEDDDDNNNNNNISSCLYLKQHDPTKKVNRDVILRRIRHRKRVNKVKTAVEALFSSPFSTTAPQKWVDDAFAAP